MRGDYLKTADVWAVLDLIAMEFQSDPSSTQCFDRRIVERVLELNTQHRSELSQQQDRATRVALRLIEHGRDRCAARWGKYPLGVRAAVEEMKPLVDRSEIAIPLALFDDILAR